MARAVECVVIRHAHSRADPALAQDDWPPSETGRAQAEALCGPGHGIERIYASPYPTLAESPLSMVPKIWDYSLDVQGAWRHN
jgi:hypothetical protein